MKQLIAVNQTNTTEWNRMARDLRRRGYIDLAWRFEVNAMRTFMDVKEYDDAQAVYREWLNNGHTKYPVRK